MELIRSIYHVLKTWSERAPQAFSLLAPGSPPVTYAQLIAQIDRVATSLRAMGITHQDCIAGVFPNSPVGAVTSIAAVSLARWAPLNPALQEREFDFYFSHLDPKILLIDAQTQSRVLETARKRAIPVLSVSRELEVARAGSEYIPDREAQSDPSYSDGVDRPSLVLFTSGTTSTPKRVSLTQTNILDSADNIAAWLRLSPTDRCLNVMPLFHIHGLMAGLLVSLMSGGSVVLPGNFDGNSFSAWLNAYQPTWYTAVPTMHQAILDDLTSQKQSISLGKLRFIRSCSAPLSPSLLQELENRFSVPVIEAYGMTEATHQISSNPLPPLRRKPGSVGIVAGPKLAITDPIGKLLNCREIGEIVIRGNSVISGYDTPTPTTERQAFQNGWFRTGDCGYIDEEGYLFVTGRLKEIINKGGQKISPREIEEALQEHQGIAEAAVFPVRHNSLGEDVAAAVVLRKGSLISDTGIREFLLDKLAGFKVPNRLLIVEQIPKTATGKIQRAALAEHFAQPNSTLDSAPADALETQVAAFYSDILRASIVTTHDNFFALGGDSLKAFQLIARIRATFALNLSIATIFLKPTVKDLAAEVRRNMVSSMATVPGGRS